MPCLPWMYAIATYTRTVVKVYTYIWDRERERERERPAISPSLMHVWGTPSCFSCPGPEVGEALPGSKKRKI